MKLSQLNAALATALFSLPTLAATSLDSVVVSANKTEQKLSEITADVHVITAEEIEAKHYSTVRQALSSVPGFSFTNNGGFGLSGNLYLRGVEGKYILVLIDGIRYNEPTALYGSPFEALMIDNIERIEVIKGAQSGVWGADAVGGVINIITKSPEKNGTTGNLTLEAGSYETTKNQLNLQHKNESLELSFSRTENKMNGMTAAAAYGENINDYEKDPRENITLSGKVKFLLSDRTSIQLEHKSIDSNYQYDAGAGTDGIAENGEHHHLFNHFLLEHKEDSFNLKAYANSANFDRKLNGEGYTYNALSSTKELGIEIGSLFNGLNLSTGVSQLTLDSGSNSYRNNGIFVSNSSKLGQTGIIANQSIRFDNYDAFADKTTFKLGFKLPFSNESSVSVNYGTGYKAPSISNLQTNQTTTAVGIETLKPESSTSWDFSVNWNDITATYFQNKINQLIAYGDADNDYQTWGDGYYYNTEGTTNIKGTEVEYKTSISNFDISTNYIHLDTADSNDNFLARVPEDQIGIDVTWYANTQWDINLNGQYIGERSEGNATDYYAVFNSVINYQANKQTRVYLKIDNLFDKYYQVVDGYATAERSAYLGLNYKF